MNKRYIYVINSPGDEVVQIDLNSGKIVQSISVAYDKVPRDIALDGKNMWISYKDTSGTGTRIILWDKKGNQIKDFLISTGAYYALTTDGNYLYTS